MPTIWSRPLLPPVPGPSVAVPIGIVGARFHPLPFSFSLRPALAPCAAGLALGPVIPLGRVKAEPPADPAVTTIRLDPFGLRRRANDGLLRVSRRLRIGRSGVHFPDPGVVRQGRIDRRLDRCIRRGRGLKTIDEVADLHDRPRGDLRLDRSHDLDSHPLAIENRPRTGQRQGADPHQPRCDNSHNQHRGKVVRTELGRPPACMPRHPV